MFRKLLVSLSLFVAIPLGATSTNATATQDAVLVSFQDVVDGASCTGIYAANCQTTTARHYTVSAGSQVFVLEHILSRAEMRRNIGAGVWKPRVDQRSVLVDQLPGVHLQLWREKDGVHIRLGDKESLFQIVGARASNE